MNHASNHKLINLACKFISNIINNELANLVVKTVSLLYRGVLYVEVILYSKECNWYTRCCLLNGGILHYREHPVFCCRILFI